MKVKLKGWEEGMQKISLTKLQTEYFGMSLKEAKTNVDGLLDDEEIEIDVKSIEEALKFIQEARQIGVLCDIEE